MVTPHRTAVQVEQDAWRMTSQVIYLEQQRWQEMAEDLWEELQEWHAENCGQADDGTPDGRPCACHNLLAAKWDELTHAADYADDGGSVTTDHPPTIKAYGDLDHFLELAERRLYRLLVVHGERKIARWRTAMRWSPPTLPFRPIGYSWRRVSCETGDRERPHERRTAGPLPRPPQPAPPARTLPLLAAYRRHRRAGEPGDACGCHELYKADQRARDHRRRKGTKRARKEEA